MREYTCKNPRILRKRLLQGGLVKAQLSFHWCSEDGSKDLPLFEIHLFRRDTVHDNSPWKDRGYFCEIDLSTVALYKWWDDFLTNYKEGHIAP